MTADRDSCIENFIQIWEAWQKVIPKSMRREDPKVLVASCNESNLATIYSKWN